MSKDSSANLLSDLNQVLSVLKAKVEGFEKPLKVEQKKIRIAEIDSEMEAPDFWSDQKRAASLQKEKVQISKALANFEKAKSGVLDYLELVEMLKEEPEGLKEAKIEVDLLAELVSQIEIERMLSGPNDQSNAILSVNVGQGGVDSQDFTEMLLRMYSRYAERRGFKVELMEITPAEEAGIKSATILVSGEYAYGYLKAEIGVHRLVRISPFDSNARRHTSFASVWVLPEIDDSFDLDIKPDDLRVDTFRAGGAGGQHVNKTESAVRITHLPTNTAVACQAERSQTKNKATAMKLLRSKLYDLEIKKRLAEKDKAEADKMEASFGSQIRNYVLAPYRIAKDLRTGHEVGNVDAVLDGEIQAFIESYLLFKSND